MVSEARRALFVRVRQGDPGLDAVISVAAGAHFRRGALGMRYAAPGHHPVHVAGDDGLRGFSLQDHDGYVLYFGHVESTGASSRPRGAHLAETP